MIGRNIEKLICEHLFQKKAILLFGARQVGKTTLLENLNCLKDVKTLFLTGDEADVREMLTNATSTRLQSYFVDNTVVVIDEAQQIPNIGTTIKLITDKLKQIQVIATGSSAFELANRLNEPLTGRKFEFYVYPLSFGEMVNHHGLINETRLIENRLVFGYYPEVVTNSGKEEKFLRLIANSYLYKDLLALENIKRSSLLEKILKALALQIGSEVSYNEIAQLVGTDSKTVEKYINLLEKAYIIIKLPALNRNVRNEIKKGKKIYFWDNGIRNAVISNYNPISSRTDAGVLWENFLVSERMKQNQYLQRNVACYFWRTNQQQEIDFIEDDNGILKAFEFKINPKVKIKLSKTFGDAYNVTELATISPKNIEEFLSH
ncbi:MAG: ATP-binding protein [Bacteroidales bacterium]|nr:ATP-binding protein [Bacteroidales bacterium]